MLVYSGTKSTFMDSVDQDRIAIEVADNILKKLGRHTPEAEFRAFLNSLERMYKVLNDETIPSDAGIAIEYNIPQTSKRVDFIISGFNEYGTPCIVIVELKQWQSLNAIDGEDGLVETYLGGGLRTVVHPSYQAWSYASLLQDYNANVQDMEMELHPCAYLHNYNRQENDPLDYPQYKIYYDSAPAFSMGQVPQLRDFIKKCIRRGDNEKNLLLIDGGAIRPSKQLQDTISNMLKGNREFYMIDEQKVAYEKIHKAARQAKMDGKKRTIIVKGGPGTGKSVIAVNLLAELTKEGHFTQYVTKNSAPKDVYLKKLTQAHHKMTSIKNLFTGPGIYVDAPCNAVDTILADEAHRLNAKSGMFHNKGENQIKEIIHASKCSVFFIDESQRVTTYDIGSEEEIKWWAHIENSEVTEFELASQFRCNGSDGYLAWLDHVLEIRDTANPNLEGIQFDFRVCDSPKELRELITEKNKTNNRSRLVAGYCWEWPTESQNNPNKPDIIIEDFSMSWNLKNYTFALDDTSVNHVGCIHTTQGLEFDYVGVIIGPDMRYVNGKIITDFFSRALTDNSVKGLKSKYKEDPESALIFADEIIKNTYRTLMTRGMKGCYIYCCDDGLQNYFKDCLSRLSQEMVVMPSVAPKKKNTINIPQEKKQIRLPVLGGIAAGHTHFMEDAVEEYVMVDAEDINTAEWKKYFLLRVCGDSMINAGISDGNLVLVYRSSKAKNGDIVACMVEGDSATLKYFHYGPNYVILTPANPAYQPIVLTPEQFEMGDAKIIGVVKKRIESDSSATRHFNS